LREALPLNLGGLQCLLAFGEVATLLNPSHQVFSDVEKHADLAEPAFEENIPQVFHRLFLRWKQALKHQARPRTLDQLMRARRIGEWV
jgi:hypothetical protein